MVSLSVGVTIGVAVGGWFGKVAASPDMARLTQAQRYPDLPKMRSQKPRYLICLGSRWVLMGTAIYRWGQAAIVGQRIAAAGKNLDQQRITWRYIG